MEGPESVEAQPWRVTRRDARQHFHKLSVAPSGVEGQ
jgi:hypothetical protein